MQEPHPVQTAKGWPKPVVVALVIFGSIAGLIVLLPFLWLFLFAMFGGEIG